jgi:hypothetical protein
LYYYVCEFTIHSEGLTLLNLFIIYNYEILAKTKPIDQAVGGRDAGEGHEARSVPTQALVQVARGLADSD